MRYLSEEKIIKMLEVCDIFEYSPHKFRDWDGNELRIRGDTYNETKIKV